MEVRVGSSVHSVGQPLSHVDVSTWYAFAASSSDAIHADEREAIAARWWRFDEIR